VIIPKLKDFRRGLLLCLCFGSGDWIRTSDLVVTLIPYFRNGVDYLIILVRMDSGMQGAYEGLLFGSPSSL
jgi:hypothetical protein